MNQPEPKNCTLRLIARGEVEVCAEDRCVFWEPGGAVLKGTCLVERLGIALCDAELATYLLEVRENVEQSRDSAEAEEAHREFARASARATERRRER